MLDRVSQIGILTILLTSTKWSETASVLAKVNQLDSVLADVKQAVSHLNNPPLFVLLTIDYKAFDLCLYQHLSYQFQN